VKDSSVSFVHYKCPGLSVTIKLFNVLLNCVILHTLYGKVAMETWHFASVNCVSDRKTFALRYCETPFSPQSSAPLLLIWEVGDREKAMAWDLCGSGSVEKRDVELEFKN